MPKIFISYRRQDSAAMAGRIYDRLQVHFGKDSVFIDLDSIPFGADFRQHIRKAVDQCDVMLAIVGQDWLGKSGGTRRIDDPRDFVRIEVEVALERHLTVIPVLIDRTTMPAEAELPESLADLAYRNAVNVDQWRDFHPHVDRLIKGIENIVKQARHDDATASSRVAKTVAELQPIPQSTCVSVPAEVEKPKAPRKPAEHKEREPRPLIGATVSPRQEPAASTETRFGPPSTPRVPWLWVYLVVLPMLAILGVIIYVVTDTGTVKITGADPRMTLRIDDREIRIENQGEPITLRTGPHSMIVLRGDMVIVTRDFQIRRGQETPIQVTYTPRPRPPAPEQPGSSKTKQDVEVSQPTTPVETKRVSTEPSRELTNSIGMKLAHLQPGEFLMGSPDTDMEAKDDEKPQHRVRITRPFYLGVTEVTRGQFRRFVDETGYKTEAEKDGKGGYGWNEEAKKFEQQARYTWLNAGFEQTDGHPVVNVSWNDAVAFVEWLSRKDGQICRLPTEAEWEYACRATTSTRYSSGDDPEGLADVGNVADGTARKKCPDWTWTIAAEDGFVYTAPVGHFRPNKWGLYDMHGNVWEWCSDGYAAGYYKQSPVDDPSGAARTAGRAIRGGSWSRSPSLVRAAFRGWLSPGYRSVNLGFRVARVQ
jgi:formylglycine-generating enzyme required for sulfatase activity